MIKRLVLFMPTVSQYHVMHHFTKQLHSALQRADVECYLMEAQHHNPKDFLEELFKIKPDATLSFNGLLPDEQGRCLADLIKIPHVACLLDSPNRFLPLITSPYTIITTPDRFGQQFFQGLNCPRTLFLPHGVGQEESFPAESERPFDVSVLASCLEYDDVPQKWRQHYSPAVCDAMEKAVEVALHDHQTTYVQVFVEAIDEQLSQGATINTNNLNYPQIFEDIEVYLKAKDRIESVRAIENAHIHVYGEGIGPHTWERYLKGKKNVTIHEGISFEEAIEVMKKSKILLNSNCFFKTGTHERFLLGTNLGSLVITNDNLFMREWFQEGKSSAPYRFGQWKELNENIKYYLSHEKERQQIVNTAKEIIAQHHTWDHRAQTLTKELPMLINAMGKG